jgi:PAS domain S-box-containing protein
MDMQHASELTSRATHFRVLLVEDNPGDVELVRHGLVDLDVTLEVVRDGVKALERLRTGIRPQLVLLDLKLPRKDGLEVLKEMSEEPALRRVPVVVLTSSQAPRDLARAYELGAMACFAKPSFGLDRLLADILRFVQGALPPPTERPDGHVHVYPEPRRPVAEDVQRARHAMAIVDSAADAIISTSLNGTITSWNEAAERLYGHEASEAIGRHIRLIIPEERTSELDAILQRVRAGARVQHLRTVRVTSDGWELHVALTIAPIRDSGGRVVGKSAIARDITDQMQAEERFRLAVEASPSAMLMVDDAGLIVMLNAEAERLFGYERVELIGESVDRLVPKRFRGAHPSHRGAFMAAPQARAMGAGRELFGRRKDGTEVPVEIGLNPIETAEGTYVLSSIVDITERRQAEERFRLAVEASPSGIVMVDGSGTIVLVNAETERMFGYPTGELIGESVDVLVPARFRGQHGHHRQSFAMAPEARTMGTGRDLYGLRRDGSELPVEVGLNPIETPQGRLVLSTIVDITSRKQTERALATQAQELARSNEELEHFAYVASHDLQEPLRMISSYTELLASRYADELDDTAKRFIAYAQDGAARMRGLIDDLLTYSRVRTRGGELVAVDASVSLALALQHLRVAIEESDAAIEADIGDVLVLADQSQLTQVFQNLISNSIRFRRESVPRIHITAHRDGSVVTFAVRDNGIGVDPQYAERIFQMFERLHTREEYEGSGIGLALSHRILDRHGGRIWIESDGREGSTFFFTLRAAPSPG